MINSINREEGEDENSFIISDLRVDNADREAVLLEYSNEDLELDGSVIVEQTSDNGENWTESTIEDDWIENGKVYREAADLDPERTYIFRLVNNKSGEQLSNTVEFNIEDERSKLAALNEVNFSDSAEEIERYLDNSNYRAEIELNATDYYRLNDIGQENVAHVLFNNRNYAENSVEDSLQLFRSTFDAAVQDEIKNNNLDKDGDIEVKQAIDDIVIAAYWDSSVSQKTFEKADVKEVTEENVNDVGATLSEAEDSISGRPDWNTTDIQSHVDDTNDVIESVAALGIPEFKESKGATTQTPELDLPDNGSNGTTITWSSMGASVTDDGVVNRDTTGSGYSELTATVQKGYAEVDTGYAVDVPQGSENEKVSVTVRY